MLIPTILPTGAPTTTSTGQEKLVFLSPHQPVERVTELRGNTMAEVPG